MKHFTAMALLAAAVFTVGCDDDDSTGPDELSQIRIVNASGTTQNLDVFSGNSSLASNIAFGSGSAQCVAVPSGSQTLTLRAAGSNTTIDEITQDLVANQDYTLVLLGDDTALLLTDDATAPAANTARIRFINTTGSAVDVHATAPGSNAFGPTATAANIGANAATTGFIDFPSTNNRLRFTDVGTQNVLFEIPTFTVPTSGIGTVVLTENSTNQFGFVSVTPCS
jgi:hypothetical protein